MSHQQSLSKVTKDLMLKEPFYGLFLIGLRKLWSERIDTACVRLNRINFELVISPEFWENLEHSHRMGLLKHELLHIAFFHLTDFHHLEDKKLANIAMDLEINQYIDPKMLPEGGMTLETFDHLNLEPKKGTQYYYDKLKNEQDEVVNIIIKGMCNGDSQVKLPDGTTVLLPDHDWGDEAQNMDETTEKLVKSQIGHMLNQVADQVAKSRGTIPGELAEIIERINKVDPPKFDWRGYMRRFVGKSTKIYTRKSRRKYNKRTPDEPGLKIKQQKHILVAIDTSGSVNKSELKEFMSEIYHMYKTGAEITIVQCDTAISHIGPFNPKKDFEVHGRGGTDFQPVINYYNENFGKYSCMFYLTDGEASAPDNCKGNILWVLSSISKMNESLPGNVIKLN